MIRLFVLPLFLILMLTGTAFSQTAASGGRNIKMTLSVEQTVWGKDSPARVGIRIENLSESAVTLPAAVSFMLAVPTPDGRIGDSFYAPASLTKAYAGKTDGCQTDLTGERVVKGAILPPGNIALKKGEVREMSFDLAALCWNRLNSSVYPNQNMFPLVKNGRYRLSFDESNEIEIEVK